MVHSQFAWPLAGTTRWKKHTRGLDCIRTIILQYNYILPTLFYSYLHWTTCIIVSYVCANFWELPTLNCKPAAVIRRTCFVLQLEPFEIFCENADTSYGSSGTLCFQWPRYEAISVAECDGGEGGDDRFRTCRRRSCYSSTGVYSQICPWRSYVLPICHSCSVSIIDDFLPMT